jgi:hypothetical protein
VHGKLSFVGRERKAQWRARRAAALSGSPPQHAPRAPVACRDLQTAQRARLRNVEPCERGAAIGGAQRLLVGPQCFAHVAAAHDDEAREVDARGRERRRVRPVRRRDPHDRVVLARHAHERRQGEAQLADAFAREQDLRQRGGRPPAAGQDGVERRMARRQGGRLGRAIAAAPDGGMRKNGGERGA